MYISFVWAWSRQKNSFILCYLVSILISRRKRKDIFQFITSVFDTVSERQRAERGRSQFHAGEKWERILRFSSVCFAKSFQKVLECSTRIQPGQGECNPACNYDVMKTASAWISLADISGQSGYHWLIQCTGRDRLRYIGTIVIMHQNNRKKDVCQCVLLDFWIYFFIPLFCMNIRVSQLHDSNFIIFLKVLISTTLYRKVIRNMSG